MSSKLDYAKPPGLIPYSVNFKQSDSEMSLSEHLAIASACLLVDWCINCKCDCVLN